MTRQIKQISITLISVIITAIASVSGAYFVYKGDIVAAQYDRISILEEQVKILQEQVINLTIANSRKLDSAKVLKDYMNGMPDPAWTKLVHPNPDDISKPIIKMWHINRAYEEEYNVSLHRYSNKTDFDIWPYEIAVEFYANDLKTLRIMSDICEVETFPLNPNEPDINIVSRMSCKWVHHLDGQIAISGKTVMIGPEQLKQIIKDSGYAVP